MSRAEDEVDDDVLNWEPSETVTAWDAASTAARGRRNRRAYGQKGQPRLQLQRAFSLPATRAVGGNSWNPKGAAEPMGFLNDNDDELGPSPAVSRELSEDIFAPLEGSTTSLSSIEVPVPRHPFRRSNSLALGSFPRSESLLSSSSLRDSSEGSSSGWDTTIGENAEPNLPTARRIRKIRSRRRASTQGSISVVASLSPLPTSTPPRTRLLTSPVSSSSRKRSPSSLDFLEEEDYASRSQNSLSRRIRSRSRLQIQEGSSVETMPYAPDLTETVGNMSVASISGCGSPPPTLSSCRGVGMDVESDSDSSGHSPDVSFDDELNKTNATAYLQSDSLETDKTDSTEPPDPADLTFLISELSKEQIRIAESWNVVASHKWTSSRRTAFFVWTKSLGFALKSIGNCGLYASISKGKGRLLLERLQSGNHAVEAPSCTPFGSTVKRKEEPLVAWPDHQTEDLAIGLAAMSVKNESITSNEDEKKDSLPELKSTTVHAECRDSIEMCNHHDLKLCLHSETPRRPLKQPLPRSSYGSVVVSTPLPGDCSVYTPMNNPTGWGSRPVEGRDWGTSRPCDKVILEQLRERFEASGKAAGVRDSCENNIMPLLPSSVTDAMDMTPPPQQQHLQIPAHLTPHTTEQARTLRKRMQSIAKRNRVSLSAKILPMSMGNLQRKSLFLSKVTETSRRSSLSLHDEFHDEFPRSSLGENNFGGETYSLFTDGDIVAMVFEFLDETELLTNMSMVCKPWADAAATANANRMLAIFGDTDDDESDGPIDTESLSRSLEWSWTKMTSLLPWGCYLSEGSFKQVFRVHNTAVNCQEAISVMDIDAITDKKMIGTEMAVSVLLSSLVRRGICPNFIRIHGTLICSYPPPALHWGSSSNKQPKGAVYKADRIKRLPREPKTPHPGRYQYIRMELCNEGDAEEYLKRQSNQMLSPELSQKVLFQIAFALHASADKFSLKHYDVKLLNVFMQQIDVPTANVVLRYALGSHVFSLQMERDSAVFAKLADYGTANISAESTGQPVGIGQFTTLENTPPDMMIKGDDAHQGHGHDNFGLGLCMLHLFTGSAPYEEILEDVVCPPNLKKRLRAIWENENAKGYDVIRCVILSDVYKDEAGNIVEGEPDEVLYDTLYRFLVLFGIPDQFDHKQCPLVWKAISDTIDEQGSCCRRKKKKKSQAADDFSQYTLDRRAYSLRFGNNPHIAQARRRLESMPGGMDLLFWLCCFDPSKRASAMDVLNSEFMENLRGGQPPDDPAHDTVYQYSAFATK